MVYKTREGEVSVIDTWTLLSTCSSQTAPGPLTVPAGKSRIKQLMFSIGDYTPAATAAGGFICLVKLEGDGMTDGEQILTPGSVTQITVGAKGATGGLTGVWRFDVDMSVKSGGTINIYGCVTSGVLVGNPSFGVTLGFA